MINILFEDNHIIVAEKPYGLLSQADITGDSDILSELKKYIKDKYNKPGNVFVGLVHRLDKNVGGVMVFAKTSKAAARLSKQIQAHKFQKTYLAIVHGKLDESITTLKHYLVKSEEERRSVAYTDEVPNSKYAELSFKVNSVSDDMSLLEVELKTGRAHQIRVQLSTIGHAIVGDRLYIEGIRDSSSSIALWANQLSFLHPVTQDKVTFSARPPKDFPWNKFNLPA